MRILVDNESLGCSQNPLNTPHISCILYYAENTNTHPMECQIMGIPRGKEGLKSQNVKSKLWGLTGIFQRGGGFKPKHPLWEGYGYFPS
jgi:hypothetical protein